MQSVFVTVGHTFAAVDLASRYRDYQVISCKQGTEALETLTRLRTLQVPVSLILVDQQLSDMKGFSFLGQARQIVPAAKYLVVTNNASEEALGPLPFKIDAVVGTCVPPEEFLFPVIDALLEQSQQQAWETTAFPLFKGVRVIGHRWSASSHHVKDFLARYAIPFQWVDLETDLEAVRALGSVEECPKLPVLQFPDGSLLTQPTSAQIAAKIGLTTQSEVPFYDLIIVGAGPAGLAAAVYGASEGLRTAIIEREAPGGQAGMSSRIENYLGFPIGLSGAELASRGVAQAARLGAHFLSPQEVTGIRVADPYRYVTLVDGSELGCYALLLSTGVAYRELVAPGAARLTGSGVYYGAAMTEASDCQGKHVYIVGGANSAGQAALYFADYARQVTLVVRGASLSASMSAYLLQEIAGRDNIDVRTNTEIAECLGAEKLEQLALVEHPMDVEQRVDANALFIFIGAAPHTQWLPERIARDQSGFVLTGSEVKSLGWPLTREPLPLETSVPGIFAAGDVRSTSIKRVASATGDGAVTVSLIHHYLRSLR